MKRIFAAVMITGFALVASGASAQESGASAGRAEVSAFPGGGIIFTQSSGNLTEFGNYALGGSFTYNINRFFGVEGEAGGALGVNQKLDLQGGTRSVKTPNTLAYNGNAIVYPTGNNRALVPYATGGIGGLTMFERKELGVNGTTTFLTGNVGGGVKYFFTDRLGVRADYRFFAVRGQSDAPAFFGEETRYGHRVYGGVVLNVLR